MGFFEAHWIRPVQPIRAAKCLYESIIWGLKSLASWTVLSLALMWLGRMANLFGLFYSTVIYPPKLVHNYYVYANDDKGWFQGNRLGHLLYYNDIVSPKILIELQSIAFYLKFLKQQQRRLTTTTLAYIAASNIRRNMHTRPDGEGFLSMHLCTCFITQKGATRTCRSASPNIKGMPYYSMRQESECNCGRCNTCLAYFSRT